MDEAILKVDDLCYSAGKKAILDKVGFSVKPGSKVSIVGPNGAGKTTLLKCLNNIISEYSGSIFISGKNVRKYSQKKLAEIVSYVPQSNSSMFVFTVWEFVMMGRYPHLSPFSFISTEDKNICREALELTETDRFADRQISTLSGGERQSVMIAAALCQQSSIILLDEPTTFLDYRHAEHIERLLLKINAEHNITIVSITHDINLAALYSDEIFALKDGRIVFSGAGEKIMNKEALSEIYDMDFVFAEHPQVRKQIVVPGQISYEQKQ